MHRVLALCSVFSALFLIASNSNGTPAQEDHFIIYVKHLEPPLRYPQLARQAQLQGTVVIKLTIGANGRVLAAKALTCDEDPKACAHPILRDETEKLIKKWTFGCANCPSDAPLERTIKFSYRLEGEGILYDDTRVSMDLPDEVTITASPVQCDHCPRKK
jgi:TonB family protein